MVDGGKEATAPRAVAGAEHLAGNENDEAGQVLVFAAEAVADPRADAGTPETVKAGK